MTLIIRKIKRYSVGTSEIHQGTLTSRRFGVQTPSQQALAKSAVENYSKL